MAVRKLNDKGGREVLRDRHVILNFRRAGYDIHSLGLDNR